MTYYKVVTHDLRPPVQGGEPQWSGELPLSLPEVQLDRSEAQCAAGYHFCARAEDALRICGLWPNGWPSRLFEVEPIGDVLTRGDKARAGGLRVLRECDEDQVRDAVQRMGTPFGNHLEAMVDAQMAWRSALDRPLRNVRKIEDGLRLALKARGLNDRTLQRFTSTKDAWGAAARVARVALATGGAWGAWGAAGDAGGAWDAAGDAWGAWDAGGARIAWDADARGAWDARDALVVRYAALRGWTGHDPDLLTSGLLDAYLNGLAVAIPVGPTTLGWALAK